MRAEKLVALFTSRDRAIAECGLAARETAANAVAFEAALQSHTRAWERLWDRDAYDEQHGQAMRLDRILEAEGDSANRYRASKQADVLMLFYLFSAEELQELIQHLGYPFDPARQASLCLDATQEVLKVHVRHCPIEPVRIGFRDRVINLRESESLVLKM